MPREIDHVVQRTTRYWYDDGLAEMAMGVVFLLVGLLLAVQAARLVPQPAGGLILAAIVIGGIWLMGRAVRILKSRITYPRTGYVRYRRLRWTRRRVVVAATAWLAFGAIVGALSMATPASLTWLPLGSGIVAGLVLCLIGYKAGLLRFAARGAGSMLIGLTCSVAGLSNGAGSALYFATTGSMLIVSGAITLHTYVVSARPPKGSEL